MAYPIRSDVSLRRAGQLVCKEKNSTKEGRVLSFPIGRILMIHRIPGERERR